MSVTIIMELRAKKGTGQKVLSFLKSNLSDTRTYDGCINIKTYQNQENTDVIVLLEEFESKDHYLNYLAWRQEGDTFNSLVADLEGPPSMRYFNLTDA